MVKEGRLKSVGGFAGLATGLPLTSPAHGAPCCTRALCRVSVCVVVVCIE